MYEPGHPSIDLVEKNECGVHCTVNTVEIPITALSVFPFTVTIIYIIAESFMTYQFLVHPRRKNAYSMAVHQLLYERMYYINNCTIK